MAVIQLTLAVCCCLTIVVNSEPCATPDSTEGECINVEDCRVVLDLEEKQPLSRETKKRLHRSQCGYSGIIANVCCPKNNATRPFEPPQKSEDSLSIGNRFGAEEAATPTSNGCGIQYVSNRIFDGTITEIDEFPWMALLAYQTAAGVGIACGGALIDKQYVLTAAHCVTGPHVDKLGKLIAVRLGEYDLETQEDCDDTSDIEQYCALPHVDMYIETTYIHPDYQPGTVNRHHDIALIRLSAPVNYTKFVKPICLPTAAHAKMIINSGRSLTICGWGKTENAEGSMVKLKAKVPLVTENACKNPYEARGIHLADSQLCAGGGKRDSCKGDSGGPLMYEDEDDPTETKWYAVGIVSFGSTPCARQGVPAVYTNIISYLPWIESIVKQ